MKKIILVEDDSTIADVYAIAMKKHDFDVEVIGLGRDAVKRVREASSKPETKPDLVLLDLILPDMNGMQVLADLKTNQATKDVVIFILSNQESSGVEDVGVKPDKFIIKANTTPTQLVAILQEYFVG